MRMRVKATLVLLGALCAAPALAAEDADNDADEEAEAAPSEESQLPEVEGSVSVGALTTSGNTESESANAALELQVDYAVWRHQFALTGYRASEEGELNAERYTAAAQSDYKFSQRSYLFVNVNYSEDRFGSFETSASASLGVGRSFVETETIELDLEVGAGQRYQDPQGPADAEDETIGRFQGDFLWRFAENARFTQSIAVESGDTNTATESVTAVRTQLAGGLAARLAHTIEYNSDVGPDQVNTDRITTLSVEYSF